MHFKLKDKLFNTSNTTLRSGFLILLNSIFISHLFILLSRLSFLQILAVTVK
jgi:hypothetical protein